MTGPTSETPSARRARVLVIDDEPLIRDVIRMMLEGRHDIVVVGSGDEARALFETDRAFDAILCDLMMAGMSGIDLHRWLADNHPDMVRRMVFMTGGAYTNEARAFVDSAQNRFIQKPLAWNALEEAVDEVVSAS